ncbi:MAG: protein kinase [Myxococcales bacterium]|nr:protein kinase [Myxococcales bacterium]
MTIVDEQEAEALATGDIVAGRYRVLRVLGRGATGTVYEAEHQWTQRRVALKVLRAELSKNERVVDRFLREAQVCAGLSHPALVAVLDMGQDEHDGLLYLAQELVEGKTLRALLDERSPRAEAEVVAVVDDIAGALAVVHAAGLVHRDVKPENIIVSIDASNGEVRAKLIDFGIAREVDRDSTQTRTQLGALLGTPRYMSPEQARATGEIDARSDQYSLAVVAYECLTGRTPHDGASTPLLLAAILTEPARPIDRRSSGISAGRSAAIMRALSSSPEARFATVRAFADAVRAPPRVPSGRVAALAFGATALVALLIGLRMHATPSAGAQRGADAAVLDAAIVGPAPDADDVATDVFNGDVAIDDDTPERGASPDRAQDADRARAMRRMNGRSSPVVEAGAPQPTGTTAPEDVVTARPALRPATFGDAGSWLRPAFVR